MNQVRRQRGGLARRGGRQAEVLAAIVLMLRGYRILGFRLKTPQGEIDLLAVKGGVLAVIEVKRRMTIEAALEAVRSDQRARLRRAGLALARNRPALAGLTVRLDLVALSPGHWPRHVPGAWPDDAS